MNNKISKLLLDIIDCIDNINKYIGKEKKFENYNSNPMLQHAVERNLEIIGEAVNKLLNIDSEIKISNARRIVDSRNKIIHGYDEIENTQIWAIIIKHLPILYAEIQNMLKK
jgi:uncharacterized protein with HEPN domain